LSYTQVNHDLRKGEQRGDVLGLHAPLHLVPAIECDGHSISQSLAILEWLEERCPSPPLLPGEPLPRALVRAMAATIACDIHPLNNLRVLEALRRDFGASDEAVRTWISRWIGDGFEALERMACKYGQGYCFGETATLADCCLIPQIYNARRFNVDLTAYPTLVDIDARCAELEAFALAVPERQPDADGMIP
jgi:maleylpyruvate isomerase